MGGTRVALVTGGCSGIGLATARALASERFSVGIMDRSVADPSALAGELASLGASGVHIVAGDLGDCEGHRLLIDDVEAALGPIDVLVNNAGVSARVRGDLLAITPEAFDYILDINLRGTFFLTQDVARRMADQPPKSGRAIVTVSSVSATMASVERGDYCLSKAALPMLTKLFALRLAEYGIGVFEVRPGIIRTPMTATVAPRYDALIAEGLVPAKRWGEAEDIANMIRMLTNPDMAFATGSVINGDGGLTIAKL